jgi:hypothetical protein
MNKQPIQIYFNNLDNIFGNKPIVIGNPKVIDSPFGKAVEFDGQKDGMLINMNPLRGLRQFTIEVVFKPYSSGSAEQRFLHIGECHGDRLLFETRLTDNGQWYLDTFIASGGSSQALMSRNYCHYLDKWYVAALVFNGNEITNYVNGNQELMGQLKYKSMDAGQFSIGVRQNLMSWFRGSLYEVRITPQVLTPDGFLRYNDR